MSPVLHETLLILKFICCLSEIHIGHCSCVFATSDNPTWGQAHLAEASSGSLSYFLSHMHFSDKILSCLIPLAFTFAQQGRGWR